MRIAFHAPMKPPDHPTPSGDRRMAREIMAALEAAGHRVDLASRLRVWDGAGDAAAQSAHALAGRREAARLIGEWAADPPDLWLTYHCYYKAPDRIGPEVARHFRLPYALIEASLAPKRAHGPWRAGHDAAESAVALADRVICVNPRDRACLAGAVKRPDVLADLPPFLDCAPFARARLDRAAHRAHWADRLGLDPDRPWLVALAMMREGAKARSYAMLADALGGLGRRDWTLIAAGDGPAREAVEAGFAGLPAHFPGAVAPRAVPGLLAACDLMVWPALDEAYGMALIEAQASGLAVVAADRAGVADLFEHGRTGLAAPEGDARAFGDAVRALLDDPGRRARLGAAGAKRALAVHDRKPAARRLDALLTGLRP